jgi:hypothetical protein
MMGVEYPRGDEYDKTAVNPWDSDPTGKGFGGASAVCAVPKKQARLAHGICTVIFGRGLVPSLMMNRNIVRVLRFMDWFSLVYAFIIWQRVDPIDVER